MNGSKKLVKICKRTNSNFLIVAIKFIFYKVKGLNIISDQNTTIKGLSNIATNGLFRIGLDYVGFTNNKDATYLNVKGKLQILGNFPLAGDAESMLGAMQL